MNDAAIIDLFWKRSETAISAVSEKYGSFCHSISYHILQDDRDAEECVNDTWLRTWNSIPPKRPSRLSVFLGRIARNLALDKYRQYHAEKRRMTRTATALEELSECISGGDNISESVEGSFVTECIEEFLFQLPAHKRIIFIRRYWYLDSIQELSDNYGISESAVTSMLFRMRKQLRQHLLREGVEV